MAKENQNVTEVAAEIKKKLKELHGEKLKSLHLPTDDNGEHFIEVLAIIPDRNIVGQFQKFIGPDPKKAQEILVKNTLKTSRDEVMADDALFYAAFSLIAELIPVRQGKFVTV